MKQAPKTEMTSTASKIPANLKKVPPFPPIAARLLALLAKPSPEFDEIARLISSDATFTARVLQHANSAAYSFPSHIESVDHAIPLIGLDRTRELVVRFGTGNLMTGGLRTAEMRTCWQHSVATAVIAEQIAKCCGVPPAAAFTAGIMHDIGRLGLLVAYPKQYEEIIRASVGQCIDILDFEREKFGVHHAEAGLFLAQLWRLPPEFHLIAGRHHDRCEGLEIDLLKVVHIACRTAQVLGYDIVRPLMPLRLEDVLSELPTTAKERMQASAAQMSVEIERRILEYDCEESETAEQPVTSTDGARETVADQAVSEAPVELDNAELDNVAPDAATSEVPAAAEVPAGAPSRAWARWAVIAAAIILTVLIVWKTR